MSKLTMIATAAFGLEAVVKRELIDLGLTIRETENGRVTFEGTTEDLVRCNLWLRCAERVQLCMGEFVARTFDELFEQTKALPWEEWIPVNGAFPVEGKSVKSTLFSISDCQAIVKKAIATRMGDRYGQGWLPEDGNLFPVQVALLNDRATLTIDTSGPGLHRRGYRDHHAPAPLRDTLASALVALSYWGPDRILWDPFCGSGTILVEAATRGLNMAPGLNREFAAQGWPRIGPEVWDRQRNDALDVIRRDVTLQILGSDNDDKALRLARRHAHRAGVGDHVKLVHSDFQSMTPPGDYGCLITNPPYGERMGELEQVEAMYRDLGVLLGSLETWSSYVITSHRGFERITGLKADRKRKLYNGRIQCNYYQYYGPRPPREHRE